MTLEEFERRLRVVVPRTVKLALQGRQSPAEIAERVITAVLLLTAHPPLPGGTNPRSAQDVPHGAP